MGIFPQILPIHHSKMRTIKLLSLLLATSAGMVAGVYAQSIPTTGTYRLKAFDRHQALANASPYKDIHWRNIGPDHISGRVTEVAGIPGNRNIMFASFATGGFWKTVDAGENWTPLFDAQATQSIGAFSLAPSNPEVIYVGTGEANIFRASLPGTGIYRSSDGGKNWQHIGLENSGTIARIIVHPMNPEKVWVAAGGNEWSHNPERGVYFTENGGRSWRRVLGEDDKTGAIDLAMDPSNPDVIIASMWNRIRRRWSDPVPEDGDHLYKSIDGGHTWKMITNGLPQTKFTGRIGIAFAPSKPDRVYAYVDNHTPKREPRAGELDPYGRPIQVIPFGVQVYRSDDKGENWQKVSTEDEKLERFAGTYGWVFGQIRVDPIDPDVVYIMGVPLAKSMDGGKTFTIMRATDKESDRTHGDHHALWIDPTDTKYIINGNDGGVVVSYNGGARWKNFFRKIPTTQFYNVTWDMRKPHTVYGSVQDEGSFKGTVTNDYDHPKKDQQGWASAPGGEGTIIAIDPTSPDIVYASSFYGRLMRSDLSKPDSIRSTEIYPKRAEGEEVHRGEWLAYTMLSPHDPNTIYHGFQYLFRSTDQGKTWMRISGDLTYNDTMKMGRTPYAINHQAITAIDESPIIQGLLYVGTDDGRVWRQDGPGATWKSLMRGIPQNAHVSRIVASKYDPAVVYLTLSNRREDDNRAYIYISSDRGETWKHIGDGLPSSPVNVVREDPLVKGLLYAGTDIGVYVSRDHGSSWTSLQANLPASVSVQDLYVHPRDGQLVIATYGRGVWVLDDLKNIRTR
jgi:photosystem II stability/assembly factor-like uncharacterized protein